MNNFYQQLIQQILGELRANLEKQGQDPMMMGGGGMPPPPPGMPPIGGLPPGPPPPGMPPMGGPPPGGDPLAALLGGLGGGGGVPPLGQLLGSVPPSSESDEKEEEEKNEPKKPDLLKQIAADTAKILAINLAIADAMGVKLPTSVIFGERVDQETGKLVENLGNEMVSKAEPKETGGAVKPASATSGDDEKELNELLDLFKKYLGQ
jgi:hypothetical protein